MNAIEMLKEFAQSQGINSKKVDEFLEQFNSPKTLEEVMALPYDMQTHEGYITWLAEPLKSFISGEMYDGQRYETIETDNVVDCLYDRIYHLLGDEISEEECIEDIGIENLETSDEDKKEQLEYFKSIAKCIIDIKFGSVVMDW